MKAVFLPILLACATCILAGCEFTSTRWSDFNFSAADSTEAREIAVWFDGTLEPEPVTVEYFLHSVAAIRHRYGDRFPQVQHRFTAPWGPGHVFVKFDEDAAAAIAAGTYGGWLLLPEDLRPEAPHAPNKLGWALYEYGRILNPWRLSEYYHELPGVLYAEPNSIGFIGMGDYTILIVELEDGLGYFFTGGRVFTPAALFRIARGSVKFIGVIEPLDPEHAEWRELLQEARLAFPHRGKE